VTAYEKLPLPIIDGTKNQPFRTRSEINCSHSAKIYASTENDNEMSNHFQH